MLFYLRKHLSLCHKLKFCNLYIFTTCLCKSLIFKTLTILSKRIHSLQYLRSTPCIKLQRYRNLKIRVCGKDTFSFSQKKFFLNLHIKEVLEIHKTLVRIGSAKLRNISVCYRRTKLEREKILKEFIHGYLCNRLFLKYLGFPREI